MQGVDIMKSNKGISMITLIITIIVMILILSISYRIGTRYITESKEEGRTALVSIMSSAVERRQNDNYSGLLGANKYYSGYHVKEEEFNKLSSFFEEEVSYEPGLWYALDAKSANDLGIVDVEKYLILDLKNIDNEQNKYIALANYYTGSVYLFDMTEVNDTINVAELTKPDGGNHTHKATVATCTEASVCTICGEVLTGALGHDYGHGEGDKYPNGMTHATCTEDLKCVRCGYIAEKATGHNYDTSVLEYNNEGHYNPCKNVDLNNGEQCSGTGNFKNHDLAYTIINDGAWHHTVYCKTDGCGYVDTKPCDKKVKTKDRFMHTVYCTLCLKQQDVEHDDLKYIAINKHKHMVHCNTCNSDLYEEDHVDLQTPYGICDKCNGIMDITREPKIVSLIMEKVSSYREDEAYAKKNDVIKVTLETDLVLGEKPTIKIQGKTIEPSQIDNPNATKWIATIPLVYYDFAEGLLNIEVSNVKSVWGVKLPPITQTTNDFYIKYDKTLPEYFLISEE